MGDKSSTAKFSAAIERAYTEPTRPADKQEDFDRWYPEFAKAHYNSAIQIIIQTVDTSVLKQLRDAYLKLYLNYGANKLNVHFVRSDQIYFELFDRCSKLSTKKHEVLTEWAAELDDKKDNPVKRRFQELSPTYQSKIRALIQKPPAPVKTILDFLRDEYQKQRGYPPKSTPDLYDFDPCGDKLKAEFEANLATLQQTWRACQGNADMPRAVFHGALKAYREYLAKLSRQSILHLLQVIKHLQDRIFLKREDMGTWTRISGGDTDFLTCELYATACIQLLKFAQGDLVLRSNRESFTSEERAYFLRPLREPKREYLYYSNIEDRFTRPLRDVPATFKLTQDFLDVILVARNDLSGATLVPLDPTQKIQMRWAVFKELGKKTYEGDAKAVARLIADSENRKVLDELATFLEIEVPIGNKELGMATARVGASPGMHKTYGTVKIVHIDPKNHNDFYVEYEGLKPCLFLVHRSYITEKIYGSRIYEVHLSTVGITYVVQGMFMMMGFMPALVEAGFAGLLYEVLVYYASSKVEEVASEINPTFGKIVGFAAQIVIPRPKFGTKIVEPAPSTALERPSIVEVKAGSAMDARGTKQAGPDWLKRNVSEISDAERLGTRVDKPRTGSVDPHSTGESGVKPGEKGASTGSTPSKGKATAEKSGGSLSETRPLKPEQRGDDFPWREARNENRTQSQVLDDAMVEIELLQEAELAAEHQPIQMAAKGAGSTRGRVAQVRGTGSRGGGSGSGGGISARGAGSRQVPRPVAVTDSIVAKLNLTPRMRKFIVRVAEHYRDTMKKLKPSTPSIAQRSAIAHEATRKQMINEFSEMVRGKLHTGVSDTGKGVKLTVREADAAFHDPAWLKDSNYGGPVIELKSWAYTSKRGSLRTAGKGYGETVSAPQIQCYEIMMDEQGIPIFVIDESARIYTRDSGRWIRVDVH